MNRIHRKLEYSLMALKHMKAKGSGRLTSAKEVAESFHAPFDATARVLQVLAQKGFLKAEHGASGGYLIQKDLNQVSLLDLIEAVDGPQMVAKCLESKGACEIQPACNIISPIHKLNAQLKDFYQGIKIMDLLATEGEAL